MLRRLLPLLLLTPCLAATAPPREQLGREIKLRILVDKVMQPVNGWVTEEWMLKETAEAGFNVFSPRRGFDDFDAVRQVTDWSAKHGLYHLPWMRGGTGVPEGVDAGGRQLVWADGLEQPLWSPNSDELWDWMAKYIVEYAKISAEKPALMGVFLDYENYIGSAPNLYALSYDRLILDKFAAARGITIPELAAAERKPWLDQQGLHESFEAFQVEHWKQKCRELRQAVDALNPAFQFCVYPAPGTKFMLEAMTAEWTTPAAPIILADPSTYGRSLNLLRQEDGLRANGARLELNQQLVEALGVPYLYTGGIDPAVRGADPEFSGKNAVILSQVTDGYWIFYEGPEYETTHPAYWHWFGWANEAIQAGRLEAWQTPRETPEPWLESIFGQTPVGDLQAPTVTGTAVDLPAMQFRRENLFLLAARQGQPIEIAVQNLPVGKRVGPLDWQLGDANFQPLLGGSVASDETGTIRFDPPADGTYVLALNAGGRAYRIRRTNVPLAAVAGQAVQTIGVTARLYFQVPDGLEQFSISAQGAGAETFRMNVYRPNGDLAETGQTTPAVSSYEIKVKPGEDAGKVWSLAVEAADEGVLEDVRFKLGPGLPPAVSLLPEHAFGLR